MHPTLNCAEIHRLILFKKKKISKRSKSSDTPVEHLLNTRTVQSRRMSTEKSIFNNKQCTHFKSLKLHPAETMPFSYDEESALTAEVRVFDP